MVVALCTRTGSAFRTITRMFLARINAILPANICLLTTPMPLPAACSSARFCLGFVLATLFFVIKNEREDIKTKLGCFKAQFLELFFRLMSQYMASIGPEASHRLAKRGIILHSMRVDIASILKLTTRAAVDTMYLGMGECF